MCHSKTSRTASRNPHPHAPHNQPILPMPGGMPPGLPELKCQSHSDCLPGKWVAYVDSSDNRFTRDHLTLFDNERLYDWNICSNRYSGTDQSQGFCMGPNWLIPSGHNCSKDRDCMPTGGAIHGKCKEDCGFLGLGSCNHICE